MNHQMPIMNGFEAIKNIRAFEEKNHISPQNIISVTATDVRKIEETQEVKADQFILKPISAEDTKKILEICIKKHSEELQPKEEGSVPPSAAPLIKQFGIMQPAPIPARTTNLVRYTFELKDYASARAVYIAGSFNDWLEGVEGRINTKFPALKEWQMTRTPEGNWILEAELPEGEYQYKFVIDEKEWHPKENNLILKLEFSRIELSSP